MQTISISEVQRNLHRLDDFGIIQIVDRKRNRVKGYYLDVKYHDQVKEIDQEQDTKTNKLLEEFRRISRDIPVLADKNIDLTKIDHDINDHDFF